VSATATETERKIPTIDEIGAAADETWHRLAAAIDRLSEDLPTEPDAGGWTVRQVLSHLIGGWQRVPMHAAFFLGSDAGTAVPIVFHDAYWISEWETAPVVAFRIAMEAAYQGTKAFLAGLDPAALSTRRQTPFGESTLGDLLLLSYTGHLDRFHLGQLEAFAGR
jgi:hypothetical protein